MNYSYGTSPDCINISLLNFLYQGLIRGKLVLNPNESK